MRQLLWLLVLCPAQASGTTLLWDVDFSSPTHVVGELPTIGAGPFPRATPDWVRNTPTVVSAVGTLADQPLEFFRDPLNTSIEGIEFWLPHTPSPFSSYEIEFELLIDRHVADPDLLPTSGFSVHFDPCQAPTAYSIRFQGDNKIRYTDPFGLNLEIGSYAVGDPIAFRATLDLETAVLSVYLDGQLAHEQDFGWHQLLMIRLLLDSVGTSDARAAVDNVRISGARIIPEPFTALLLAAGLMALAVRRRVA